MPSNLGTIEVGFSRWEAARRGYIRTRYHGNTRRLACFVALIMLLRGPIKARVEVHAASCNGQRRDHVPTA